MIVEATNDVDPKHRLHPRCIKSVQGCVGDVWVGIVWACIVIFMFCKIKTCVGEWCCDVVGSCEVQQVARCSFLLPRNLLKTCICVCEGVCVCLWLYQR